MRVETWFSLDMMTGGLSLSFSGAEVSGGLGAPGFSNKNRGEGEGERGRGKVWAEKSLALFSWEPLVLQAGFSNNGSD